MSLGQKLSDVSHYVEVREIRWLWDEVRRCWFSHDGPWAIAEFVTDDAKLEYHVYVSGTMFTVCYTLSDAKSFCNTVHRNNIYRQLKVRE